MHFDSKRPERFRSLLQTVEIAKKEVIQPNWILKIWHIKVNAWYLGSTKHTETESIVAPPALQRSAGEGGREKYISYSFKCWNRNIEEQVFFFKERKKHILVKIPNSTGWNTGQSNFRMQLKHYLMVLKSSTMKDVDTIFNGKYTQVLKQKQEK